MTQQPSFKAKSSLLRRSVLLILLSTLFAAVTITATAYQLLSRTLIAQSTVKLERNLAYHAEFIRDQLAMRKAQMASMAPAFLHENGTQLLSLDEMNAYLERDPRRGGLFSEGIVVLDTTGTAIAESIFVPNRIGTNYYDRPHIRDAIDNPRIVIGGPFIGRRTGLPLINFMAPIWSTEGVLLGVLSSILDLADESFYAITENPLPLEVSQQLYIFDLNNNYAIRHPNLPPGIQPLPDADDSLLVSYLKQPNQQGDFIDEAGQRQLVATQSIDDLGWTLIVTASYDEVAAIAIAALWRFVGVAAMVLVLVMLVSVRWVLRILKPLKHSTEAIEHMAQQPQSVATLPDSPLLEINRLNQAFNILMGAKQQLQAKETWERNRFAALFSQSSIGLIMLEPKQWHIELINQNAQSLLGVKETEAINKPIIELLPGLETVLMEATLGNESQAVPEIVQLDVQHGQQHLVLDVNLTFIQTEANFSVLLSVQDVTEKTQLQSAKDEFISTVSHELRTPLTALMGSLKMLQADLTGTLPDSAKSMLSIALKSIDRLANLVNDLLDINRLIMGRMNFDSQWLSINELVQEVFDSNQPYATLNQIELVLEPMEQDHFVYVDATRFNQVLNNLVGNAIKFSPAHSQVNIRVAYEEAQSWVFISDEGPGIPEAFHERIFQRFAQADSSSRRAQEGTGLGLSICRELTEQMAGYIDFDHHREKGACFWVCFPSKNNSAETS